MKTPRRMPDRIAVALSRSADLFERGLAAPALDFDAA